MLTIPATFLTSLLLLAPSADGWLGIFLDTERTEAIVMEVIPGSPAEKAGLRAGDELLGVGDVATKDREAFIAAIRACKAGDRVSLKLRRDGKEQVVMVKLEERPEQVAVVEPPVARPSRPQAPSPAGEAIATPVKERGFLGVSIDNTEDGIVIGRVLPGSPAEKAGLQAGDRLTQVGDRKVRSMEDVDGVLGKAGPGDTVAIGVRSERGARIVNVVLGKRGDEATAPAPRPPVEIIEAPRAEPKPPVVRRDRGQGERDVEAELQALRAELAELRKQIEALKQQKGRE
ncbi:MAG: PDZ domain-containing protein [Planctomycetes bacterium]|nr:PDZ domain-containing protein [Planctomycetota bacterium]